MGFRKKTISSRTQCARRPFCVIVMKILSAKLTTVAVVSRLLIDVVADFVRAGYEAGLIV